MSNNNFTGITNFNGDVDIKNNDIVNTKAINPVSSSSPLTIGNTTDVIELKGSVIGDLNIRQFRTLFPASSGTPMLSGFYSMLTPITNSGTTEVSIYNDTGSFGTRTMPSNALIIGQSFSTSSRGTFSTLGISDITARIKINGVTIATSVLSSFLVNTGTNWNINADWAILTTGAGGTGYVSGLFVADDGGKMVSTSISGNFALDTTIANTLDITLQWASAGNEIISNIAHIKNNY